MRIKRLLALSLAAALAFVLAGCGGGSDPPPKVINIAYIYNNNETEAVAYENFLEAESHLVTLVQQADIADTDFSGYDLIIIGKDNSNVFDQYEANWLNAFGKPVIGIHRGGLAFFSYSGLYTVYDKCVTFMAATGVVVFDHTHLLWNSPNYMDVDDDAEVELYDTSCNSLAVYAGSIPGGEDIFAIGKSIQGNDYIPLLTEDRYLYWGFGGNLDTMTEDGKDLFINAVAYMAESVSP